MRVGHAGRTELVQAFQHGIELPAIKVPDAADMGTGIIIDQFIGFGQSNTLMGQFSANLDLAWLVNKGEVQGRLKNCMVADDVTRMLDDTIVLSKEREWIGDSYLPYVMCRINYTTI